jgi:hypothetical protein
VKSAKRFIDSLKIGQVFRFTFYHIVGPNSIGCSSAIIRLTAIDEVHGDTIFVFNLLSSNYPKEGIKYVRISKSKLIAELEMTDSMKGNKLMAKGHYLFFVSGVKAIRSLRRISKEAAVTEVLLG